MKATAFPTAALVCMLSTLGLLLSAQDTQAQTDSESHGEDCPDVAQARRFSTRDGSTGGLSIVDPETGTVGALRLQLALDSFPADDFLQPGNQVGQGRQALSVSVTALRNVEVFGALNARSTTSQSRATGSISAQAADLGIKLSWPDLTPFHFGGDLRMQMQNELGGQLPLFKATSLGLRAAGSFDGRELPKQVPLVARMNLEYLFDNSAQAVEALEFERYQTLSNPLSRRDEQRNLVTRFERYALGVNRVDRVTIGLGLEAPLNVARNAWIHPLLEWKLGMPVNRQGYDCAIPAAGSNVPLGDRCLGQAGLKAWPMDLLLGVRVVPPIRGVTFSLAVDFGLTGTSAFVHELAPISPFTLLLALGYDYEPRP